MNANELRMVSEGEVETGILGLVETPVVATVNAVRKAGWVCLLVVASPLWLLNKVSERREARRLAEWKASR